MKLRKFIHPIIALTLCGLLYTGCDRKAQSYIFTQPSAIAYSGQTPISEGGTASLGWFNIDVSIPTQVVNIASIFTCSGNMAYATSFHMPPPVYLEKIINIHIRPVNSYNAKYAALDDMSEDVVFTIYSNPTDSISKDVLLSDNNNFPSEYVDVIPRFNIWFKEPPAETHKLQQFIVEIITDRNSKLADTTQSFILIP